MKSQKAACFGIFVAFLMIRLPVVRACHILRDPVLRAIGVTPSEADEAEGLAIVIYENSGLSDKKERIKYNADAKESDYQVDAFMLIDRDNSSDLLRQVETHLSLGGFKSSSIACVKQSADCTEPNFDLFPMLWLQSLHTVVLSCGDTHFIYNPFKEQVLPFNGFRMAALRNEIAKIWSNMMGTLIRVSAIEQNLSFSGKKPRLGKGLDSSLLYEFSRQKNFTPSVIKAKNYRISNLQVWTHQAEFGVNSRFYDIYEQKLMMSSVIYGDDMCLIVRRKPSLRGWEVLQLLFHVEVWFVLPVALLVINSVLSLACQQRSWWSWLSVTLRSLFTVPLKDDIKESKERLILGSCFLFSLIFTSYLQAMLFQIVRAKPPVEYPSEDLLYKFSHVMKRQPYNGSFTVMRRKEYTLSVKEGFIKSQDYGIKCPGYTRNLAYILNYGTAMQYHVNSFVQFAFEAGLPEAWFSMTLNARRQYIEDEEQVKVLDIVDFEVAFLELVIGLTLSCLVFVGEQVCSRFVYVGGTGNDVLKRLDYY